MKKSSSKSPRGPVAQVWSICQKMTGDPRKDIVAACLKAGVNVHTAKTQIQRFNHASPAQKATMLREGSLREQAAPKPVKKTGKKNGKSEVVRAA